MATRKKSRYVKQGKISCEAEQSFDIKVPISHIKSQKYTGKGTN